MLAWRDDVDWLTVAVNAEQLVDAVRRADHAMYQAKRSGKDNVTLAEEAGYVP
jgi:PleD family two-component response regulator